MLVVNSVFVLVRALERRSPACKFVSRPRLRTTSDPWDPRLSVWASFSWAETNGKWEGGLVGNSDNTIVNRTMMLKRI